MESIEAGALGLFSLFEQLLGTGLETEKDTPNEARA